MSLIVSFICGCTHEVPSKKEDLVDPLMLDPEGFVVCASHNSRRLDWRVSISTVGGGRTGEIRPGWTDIEKEQWEIWGDMPTRPGVVIDADVVDRRELRDFVPAMERVLAKPKRKKGSARRAANRVENKSQSEQSDK
jgi:hypothetical protein